MKQLRFINAFQLKIGMAVLMLLDHLYYNLFPQLFVWHCAARVVAPVFAYLMTQSLLYTRNRTKYLGRLFGFSVLMFAGNAMLYALLGRWIPNNIFLSLTLSATLLVCIEKGKEQHQPGWYAAATGIFLVSVFSEGAFLLPVLGLVFFYLRKWPTVMFSVYIFVSILFNLPMWWMEQTFPPQLYMVFAVVPLLFYNGKRGNNSKFARYFFYLFYPIHIWIIFIIEQITVFS